jgi:NAD(P)-dependent dehydrogenase (short-subunit alcohol dehydrogenase family)
MSTNLNKLNGKVAVVTGASKGIGAAIAKHFASEGAAVVVNYASSKTGADKVSAIVFRELKDDDGDVVSQHKVVQHAG